MCLSPGEPPGHRGHQQARPGTQAIWSYRALSFIYKRVTESSPPPLKPGVPTSVPRKEKGLGPSPCATTRLGPKSTSLVVGTITEERGYR